MSQPASIYEVFVARPSDVTNEADAVMKAILHWNAQYGVKKGIMLCPTSGDLAHPTQSEKPQPHITRRWLNRADALIGVFGSWPGTPTQDFQGGAIEEVETFTKTRMLYFYAGDVPNEKLEAAAKVKQFRNSCKGRGLVREFDNIDKLTQDVVNDLTDWTSSLNIEDPRERSGPILKPATNNDYVKALRTWNSADRPGDVLLFNIELRSFATPESFDQTWGSLDLFPNINNVCLCLPRFKLQRLFRYMQELPRQFVAGSLLSKFTAVELSNLTEGNDVPSPLNTAFAMFRFKDSGQIHSHVLLFVLSQPFSRPIGDSSSVDERVWEYRQVLHFDSDHDVPAELLEIWAKYVPSETSRPLIEIRDQHASEELRVEEILKKFPQQNIETDPDFDKTMRIRGRLFDPNVPTYVLDDNYILLDWNPAFDLVFPTDRFHRGQFATEFLQHLKNYEEVVNNGREFLASEKPLFHREPFVFESPKYGCMQFTKTTSPALDYDSGERIGWNLALNVDSVQQRSLYEEDVARVTAYQALVTRYAGPYDDINSRFPAYGELADLHVKQLDEKNNILDLGAGSGCVTLKLLEQGKKVTSVEMNDAMLQRLLAKCAKFKNKRRFRVLKSNIAKLHGLRTEYDGAVLLHVLYAIDDPLTLLKSIHKLLVPGGRLVLANPKDGVDVRGLFAAIEASLGAAIRRTPLKESYQVYREINERMANKNILVRHPTKEVKKMLNDAGFDLNDNDVNERVFANQGVFMVATRRDAV